MGLQGLGVINRIHAPRHPLPPCNFRFLSLVFSAHAQHVGWIQSRRMTQEKQAGSSQENAQNKEHPPPLSQDVGAAKVVFFNFFGAAKLAKL